MGKLNITSLSDRIMSVLIFIIVLSNLNAQSNKVPETKKSISKSTIDVEYKTVDSSGVNWNKVLASARVVPTLDKKGIRITLPNSDPAKVIIMDKTGSKMLKTIAYVAPAIIDISDLFNDEYQLILESHHAVTVISF